jgi:phytoene dehydrogenase-like protein
MDILSVVLIAFGTMELLDVLTLYLAPSSRRGNALGVFREHAADAMTAALDGQLFPGLGAKVRSRFMTTPVTLEAYTGNTDGAIVGWAFDGAQMPAVHQMQRVARSVLTPIPGVLQAGQWTYSPGGVPMAFLTGKLAANRALKVRRRRR